MGTITVSILGSHENFRDGVGVEVDVQNLAVAEVHLFGQRISQPHGDAAFHLDGGPLGIDYLAHVLGADHPFDLDFPLLRSTSTSAMEAT